MKSSVISALVRFVNKDCRIQRPDSSGVTRFVRLFLLVLFLSGGAALGFVALTYPESSIKPLRLAYDHPATTRINYAPIDPNTAAALRAQAVAAANQPDQNLPTFGQPIISGIQGVGFEQGLPLDPSNPNRLYTSAPGSLSSNTSWIWQSLDGGLTFKWVTSATPLEGKATPACAGGGDTETGVDLMGRLYFCDLTLANFSTARSDDQGATFLCSNTGVPDAVVDRQWYAFDGDPLNGGSIYLTNDEFAQGPAQCGAPTNFGQNILVMYRSPITGGGPTAGIQFGPANKISNMMGCDEGIMGNNDVSPDATT